MMVTTGETHEARTAARRATMAPSTLRAENVAATDVTVVDLSQTGFRIATAVPLQVGDEISIGLSGVGTRRAYVAWRRDGEYGCAFDQPLEIKEAQDAFTSASVVRLGSAEQVADATRTRDKGDMQELYGSHSLWRMPLDAVLMLTAYLLLGGWLFWRVLLAA